MRIIYLGSFRLPNLDAAAPRVLNNARIMQLCGHKVSFISWGGTYNDEHLRSDGKYWIDGMEYTITDELDPKGSLLSKMWQLFHRGNKTLTLLNSINPKPDLIVMYNAEKSWTKKMKRFCNYNNIKLANDITEWYDNNEIHFWSIPSYHINMTKTQRYVKNKIVISSFLNHYYQESNNVLLPPLCDPENEKWTINVVDERIKPFDGITLIYAGNPAKKDCVHTVINAVISLSNKGDKIRFLILGVTREHYLSNYRNKLKNKDLNNSIIFLGRVSQDLIPAYYNKADFMVLLREPTRKNMAGFPTKFAESMTAGIPVIANATSDIGQIIRNGENGFIIPGYKYEDILTTLKEKVLSLTPEDITRMKEQTIQHNEMFDYRTYKNIMGQFLTNLR